VSRRRIFSPAPLALTFTPSPAVDRREVEAIVSALRRQGPLGPRELSRQMQAPLWGPGRFRAALARGASRGARAAQRAADVRRNLSRPPQS